MAAVRRVFVGFTATFEGVCTWMYCDVKGLVTTAIGNLVDPSGLAIVLPFLRPDGTPATRQEIAGEWLTVKSRQDLRLRGGGAYKANTKLRLSDEGVQKVVLDKLAQVERVLKSRFPAWDDFPADAQLAILSLAWAMGPAFHMPKLAAAIERQDWTTATQESHLDDTHNAGLKPRNLANLRLFQNAARVAGFGLDPETLFYPGDAVAPETEPSDPTSGPAA